MNEEQNPFEEYYKEIAKKAPKAETAKQIIASLEAKATQDERKKKVTEDANAIRATINAYIKDLKALADKVFADEKEKKTRTDLIVTMVIGGLAYTAAAVYQTITRGLNIKMSAEEYEATFLGMFQTAVKDLGKE